MALITFSFELNFDLCEFTGCDGSPLSDEGLRVAMAAAVDREDFEAAARYRDELKRRQDLENNPENE